MFYNLNNNVKYLRKRNNITQLELSKKLNISKMSLSNFEGGSVNTSLKVLDKLHQIFGISIDDLIYKDLSKESEGLWITLFSGKISHLS